MARVYFSLGSNQGDRLNSLVKATQLIDTLIGPVVCYSPVIESEPWGFSAELNFYNMVLEVQTALLPREVLASLLAIEKTLGRVRSGAATYSSRIIDIDILFYGEEHIVEDTLVIPHPMLHLRRFVLEPLASLAPLLIHPVSRATIAELLLQLEDQSRVFVAAGKEEFALLLHAINKF